jgi:polyisoprenoid-binding protein YceI
MKTSRPSSLRRAAAMGGAALVIAASTLGVGAYSYLKPTAPAGSQVSAVPLTTMSALSSTLADTDEPAAGSPVYEIQSATSSASFVIDEVLRGDAYTVVGTTNQVAGQIAFDSDDPAAAQVGTILIDARALTTDDDSRTRALGNRILNTDQYPYITFTPLTLSGLPTSVATAQPFTFQATGNLTIKDVTKPATFDITVTPTADGDLAGTATTTIQYADWNVAVPSVPFVAGVEDEVTLNLDFAAANIA